MATVIKVKAVALKNEELLAYDPAGVHVDVPIQIAVSGSEVHEKTGKPAQVGGVGSAHGVVSVKIPQAMLDTAAAEAGLELPAKPKKPAS